MNGYWDIRYPDVYDAENPGLGRAGPITLSKKIDTVNHIQHQFSILNTDLINIACLVWAPDRQ